MPLADLARHRRRVWGTWWRTCGVLAARSGTDLAPLLLKTQ